MMLVCFFIYICLSTIYLHRKFKTKTICDISEIIKHGMWSRHGNGVLWTNNQVDLSTCRKADTLNIAKCLSNKFIAVLGDSQGRHYYSTLKSIFNTKWKCKDTIRPAPDINPHFPLLEYDTSQNRRRKQLLCNGCAARRYECSIRRSKSHSTLQNNKRLKLEYMPMLCSKDYVITRGTKSFCTTPMRGTDDPDRKFCAQVGWHKSWGEDVPIFSKKEYAESPYYKKFLNMSTQEFLFNFYFRMEKHIPDVIIMNAGLHDTARISCAEYESNLKELIHEITSFIGKFGTKVYWLLTTAVQQKLQPKRFWNVTSNGVASCYNNAAIQLMETTEIIVVDTWKMSLNSKFIDLHSDGVHLEKYHDVFYKTAMTFILHDFCDSI
jgi:hypothetical protein